MKIAKKAKLVINAKISYMLWIYSLKISPFIQLFNFSPRKSSHAMGFSLLALSVMVDHIFQQVLTSKKTSTLRKKTVEV